MFYMYFKQAWKQVRSDCLGFASPQARQQSVHDLPLCPRRMRDETKMMGRASRGDSCGERAWAGPSSFLHLRCGGSKENARGGANPMETERGANTRLPTSGENQHDVFVSPTTLGVRRLGSGPWTIK